MSLANRITNAWNAFRNAEASKDYYRDYGASYGRRPDGINLSIGTERSIMSAIINRIATDVALVDIKHVRTDDSGRYVEDITSGLNTCLTLSANIDQNSNEFINDFVTSVLDEGCAAMVPIDTDDDPNKQDSFGIESIRVGKILEWMPRHIRVEVYDENEGKKKQIIMAKQACAIMQNPFYEVMNASNSTLKRLTNKISLMDHIDAMSGSGRMDLIVQLPYSAKTELKRKEADKRRQDIETQLTQSKYGIAYLDGTEKIIQLNRPVENTLFEQVKQLTTEVYSQMGLTQEILNGTANEETMTNYMSRVIEPILVCMTKEMKRKFLTQTARTRGQDIQFFRNPFKIVPVTKLADIADRFTRNEIMTSNEFRQIVGLKPSSNPDADELRNKNLNKQDQGYVEQPAMEEPIEEYNPYAPENHNTSPI